MKKTSAENGKIPLQNTGTNVKVLLNYLKISDMWVL